MDALKHSDFWFGIVLAIFFGLAAFLFFGNVVTDLSFWLNAIVVVGFSTLAGFIRGPLDQLDRLPRYISWFSIGVTLVVVVSAVAGFPFDWLLAIMGGLFLVGISHLPVRTSAKSGYGEEGR